MDSVPPVKPFSQNGDNGRLVWWKRGVVGPVIAAVVGTLLGGPGFRALEDPRKDPATGRDLEAVEARVVGLIDAGDYAIRVNDSRMEERLDRMDTRFNALTGVVSDLPPAELLERLTRAEEKLKYLEQSCVRWADAKLQD